MGVIGETTPFDTSRAAAFADATVQAAIVDLTKPRGYALGGRPSLSPGHPRFVWKKANDCASSSDTQIGTRSFDTVIVTTSTRRNDQGAQCWSAIAERALQQEQAA